MKACSLGLRVLVVDDNTDAADSLAILLDALGCETSTAYEGLGALEAARQRQPNAIVLDIGLPGLDGYEVARRLRRAGFEDTLIVALTGYGAPKDRERSREAGFDAHLTKPLVMDDLLGLLASRADAMCGESDGKDAYLPGNGRGFPAH